MSDEKVTVRFIVHRSEYIECEAEVLRSALIPSKNTLDKRPVYDAYQSGQYEEIGSGTDWSISGEDIEVLE